MIEATGLTKRYGSKTAVAGITFTVQPGRVTGFLGPNGAGKSTTMRMIMGLDAPTSGAVRVNGQSYLKFKAPLHEVGALLEAKAVHSGRSAYHHLRGLAATHGIPTSRVRDVIELTGLTAVAGKRVGGFSLGMGQRLGIAAALLGDPQTLILDEPVNGLDPEGVLWVRTTARALAAAGKTVFLSSHLMSEMALTADHLLVIGRGRILADMPVEQFINQGSHGAVTVVSPQADKLAHLLASATVTVTSSAPSELVVSGTDAVTIGDAAAAAGIALHQLVTVKSTLEDAYLELTADSVEYHTKDAVPATAHAGAAR